MTLTACSGTNNDEHKPEPPSSATFQPDTGIMEEPLPAETGTEPDMNNEDNAIVLASPNGSRLAVVQWGLPGIPEPLLIYDNNMNVLQQLDMESIEEQEFVGISDLRWVSEDKILIGIDYNLYVRGYYQYDLLQSRFDSDTALLAKAGQGVLELLDESGDHLIYQYPNERYFSSPEAPAIYVGDMLVFQAKDADVSIGEITVDRARSLIEFPLISQHGTRFYTFFYTFAPLKFEQQQVRTLKTSDDAE